MSAATPNAIIVRDAPGERDYSWSDPQIADKPTGPRHYRDLPIIGGHYDPLETVNAAFSALSTLTLGNMLMAGYLADEMLADDRIQAVMDTRLDALASLPLEVAPRTQRKRAQRRAEQLTDEWSSWIADGELKKILFWGRMVNLGLGEILWDTSSPGYWRPRVKAWDPRNVFWRWDTRSFWVTTLDGITELRPGDGHWILYCPHGYARGWMHSLIRALVPPFLRRNFAYRDWARYSEIHGIPIKVLYVPARASEDDKDQLVRTLRHLNSEGLIECSRAKDDRGEEVGYDVKLVEPVSNSWQGFLSATDKDEQNIATLVLGQPLTSSPGGKGATHALGTVQDRIRLDRLESDAKSLGDCLAEQLVKPWAIYNWSDPQIAPFVRWSTKAPEDRAKLADTLSKAGDAANKWRAAGFNVDRIEYAKQFGVKLDAKQPLVEPDINKPVAPSEEKPNGGESPSEYESAQPENSEPEKTDAEA